MRKFFLIMVCSCYCAFQAQAGAGKSLSIENFSIFWAQPTVEFNVDLENNQAILSWSELSDVQSVLIERSTNSKDFEPISQLFANAYKNSYIDDLSNQAINSSKLYYRLTFTFKDGAQKTSQVEDIVVSKMMSFKPKVMVNGTNISFQFQSLREQLTAVRIFNSTTGLIKQLAVSANEGENNHTLQLNGAHSGLYFMQIEQSGHIATTKFFIQ